MSSMSIGSRWSKQIIFTLCLLWVGRVLPAQVVQSGRFEVALNDQESSQFGTQALGENGLVMYRQISGMGQDQLEIIKVDTTFREIWKVHIDVNKTQSLLRVDHHKDSLFLLFKDRFYLGGDFQLVNLDLVRGDYTIYIIKNLIPFNPLEFMVTQKAALIGGYYNYRPIVLHFSFSKMRSKILPGFFNTPGELNQLTSDVAGNIEVVVSARNFEKKKSLWIRDYDAEGELIKTTIIRPEENKNLLFGRSLLLSDGGQMVLGVYGRSTDYSRGIFLARVKPNGEYSTQYYNFSELHNFFTYMKSRRQKRIKDRIERRTAEGKKIKFNYRFLIHDIIPYQGQFIMTGEAFYPHYHYSSMNYPDLRYSTNSVSMPGANNNLILDYYLYTHAVVIGFDVDGNMLWDNSFEINDAKSKQLGQFAKVRAEQNRIIMLYLFQNILRTKVIQGSEVLNGKTLTQMKTSSEGEVADPRAAENENLDYWYGRYFYACGVQKLRTDSGPWRKVFYISKIAYK